MDDDRRLYAYTRRAGPDAAQVVVEMPPGIARYSDHAAGFLHAMVLKLVRNSHKDTPSLDDVPTIIEKLRAEIVEFEQQFAADPSDVNALWELADCANFALLTYVALQERLK